MSGRVLYIIGCGSPAARKIGVLVGLAQNDGWDVCVVTTPDGRKFVDVPALAAQTGYPVRSVYKNPGDPDVLPNPHAIIVAPASVNTVNKWSVGITDTLALGLLVEAQGRGLPIVAVPLHAPGTMDTYIDQFPWQLALDALRERDNAGLHRR